MLLREWLKEKTHKKSPWGEALDSNGYSESLLPSENCFMCGIGGDLARHEVFGGADRKTSKATGMWVSLCPVCHEKAHKTEMWSRILHQEAQMMFEHCHSHDEFIELFGKNYL